MDRERLTRADPEPSAIRGRRVVTPEGVRAASVHIAGGRIAAISAWEDVPAGVPLTDAGDAVVMTGLVYTHVHVNEPGSTEWEGFRTATSAAAAGGVTTLLDMPLNSVPATTSADALEVKRTAAREQCFVDVGFIGGVVPGNAAELRPLHAAGVLAFKCFMVPSGVDEFGHVGEQELREALPILAELGAPLMVHAESPGRIALAARELAGDPRQHASWLASRPPEAEVEAIELLVRLGTQFGGHLHVVHLSASEALPVLHDARWRGIGITVETCPHYLTFSAEECHDGATELKCAPPIRDSANREKLWKALNAGDLDMVVSDHSPCPPDMKGRASGDFFAAWGGIASLQLGLGAVWTGARQRGIAMEHLAEWMSAAPARLAGLSERKGSLAPGHDADIVIWSPESEYTVDPGQLLHRHPITPYAGRRLAGTVEATYLRGRLIYAGGAIAGPPRGQLLTRGEG